MVILPLVLGGIAALIIYEKTRGAKAKKKGKGAGDLPLFPINVEYITPGGPGTSPTVVPASVFRTPLAHVVPSSVFRTQLPGGGGGPTPPQGPTPIDVAGPITGAAQRLMATTVAEPGLMGDAIHTMVKSYLRDLAMTPTLEQLKLTIEKLSSPSLSNEGSRAAGALTNVESQIQAHTGMAYPARRMMPPQFGWDPWPGIGLGIQPAGGLLPMSGPAVDAGNVYEDTLVAGSPAGLGPRPLHPQELPELVMHLCATILAQAAEKGGAPPLEPPPPGSPNGVSTHQTIASQAGVALQGLHRGHTYFVAWPSGAPPLRKDLWQFGRVTDSAMSPNHFAADPGKEPIPMKAVPASAPPAWLSAYGRGKAIAVLVWAGPEGSSDPVVEVLGEYVPAGARQAA